MLKHIVMWRLKETTDPAEQQANARRMKELLEALPAQIKQIRQLEVGINTIPDGSAADVVLVSAFNCADCLAAYQAHPAHQEVVAFVRTVVSERRVIDYLV
jgi:hypothetical protein